jgi:4-hydroxybenzoate polyprenyltransferase
MLPLYLVRARAWWFNKVPLSVTLVLLLIDGASLSLSAVLTLVLVVLTVCAVGNYGYALNELYDVEEDARAGRPNAVVALGSRRVRQIVVVSAISAEVLGTLTAGAWGAGLTIVELFLPFAYSVPPLRIKERKWLGIVADALAAHVYPAALALLTVSHLGVSPISSLMSGCVLTWSAAVGVRGILSHQLHTVERDRQGGLSTVVHEFGHLPLERFIAFVLLPIEAAAFAGAAAASGGGPILWGLGTVYLASEAFRTLHGGFVVTALRPKGQRYLPFVEESFYKAWGPIVLALDAARVDLIFLVFIPLYAWLFKPHLLAEESKIRAIVRTLRFRAAGPDRTA